MTILGACQSDRADFAAAETTLRSAIEELAAAGDARWPAYALSFQARLESQLETGETRAASRTFDEAYALAREIDDPCWLAVSLRGMALVAQREGDPTRALGLLEDGLRRAREQPDSYVWAEAIILTDLVSLQRGGDRRHVDDATRIVTRGPMPDLAARLAAATATQTPGQTERR